MNFTEIEKNFKEELQKINSKQELSDLKNKYLSKKGLIPSMFSELRNVPPAEKAEFGNKINSLKTLCESSILEKENEIKNIELQEKLNSEKIDITLPSKREKTGSKNPYQLVVDDFTTFFTRLGFAVAEGPEVETDHYNFELLNTPKDHPARDMQDSFFIDTNTMLRSHTSAIQAHVMENAHGQAPIKIVCPGKVFRKDNDATHSHQFGQVEGLVISENVNMGTLMETLTQLLQHLFGKDREVRFRPSYFPFTEPSVEVDVSCFNCNGKGCSLCKETGWIEILGAGMVHPNVLRLNGFDCEKYQGYAFGVGIDRIAMLKYGIDDIKRIYTNDIDFLKQFENEGK